MPIYGCRFPMQVHQYFIIVHQLLSHPHVHPSHHTHLTTLSLSLGGKDDSLSYPALSANYRSPTNLEGRRRKDLSLIKGSIGHRMVHIRGHGYTYRSINSIEGVHLEPQDNHHRWCAPPRLILGYLPTSAMPPYLAALGPPRSPPKC